MTALAWAASLGSLSDHVRPAEAFHVPLDGVRIQGLQKQFTVLDFPTKRCIGPDGGPEESGAWNPSCVHGLTKHMECAYTGFQYSMEWYFMQVLHDNEQYIAPTPDQAEFVYFPHCVSQVYFALRQMHNLTHWAAIAMAEMEYLVPLLRWAHGTELHRRHGGLNFWTVFSMDLGRQDFPRSAAWLEHWSVGSLTGSEQWLSKSNAFFKSVSEVGMDPMQSCWKEDTEPVTVASDMFPARNFRPHDTVISIPPRFPPENRSFRFGDRPVLVFFAGSPNSCARKRILDLYSGSSGFDVSTHFNGDSDYRERMWRARFCLVLRGSSHTNNVRLYEVIAHGCVPVIISDDFQPPLDKWLPWHDMAIFLPTARIPDLGHILRHEFDEAQRWRYFTNIVLGRGIHDAELATAIVERSGGRLDRDTLWSGLSASRIFNWQRSDFWMLFLADVQQKLTARMHVKGPPQTSHTLASRSFGWKHNEWQTSDEDDTPTNSGRTPGSGLLLIFALRWTYDAVKKREQATSAVLDCGDKGLQDAPQWLEAFGGTCDRRFCSDEVGCRATCGTESEIVSGSPLVLSFAPSARQLREWRSAGASKRWSLRGWRCLSMDRIMRREGPTRTRLSHVQASLRVALKQAKGNTEQHDKGDSDVPSMFLARFGPQCRAAAAVLLITKLSGSPSVKFLWLTGFDRNAATRFDAGHQTGRCFDHLHCRTSRSSIQLGYGLTRSISALASQGGWLCFCLQPSGRWRPLFQPFSSRTRHGATTRCRDGEFLCGREGDQDLDMVLRLTETGSSGIAVPLPQPARWGMSLEGHGVGVPSTLEANALGRFSYVAHPRTAEQIEQSG